MYSYYEEAKVQYEEGDLLTAVRGEEQYTFIYLNEHTDGTLLGLGMHSQGIGREIMRYTKKRCRRATQEEKDKFVALCKDKGLVLQYIDGKVDIFKLRGYGQKYYSTHINFTTNEIDVVEFKEEHDFTDNHNYETGNYFRSEEEARKSFTRFVDGL